MKIKLLLTIPFLILYASCFSQGSVKFMVKTPTISKFNTYDASTTTKRGQSRLYCQIGNQDEFLMNRRGKKKYQELISSNKEALGYFFKV